MSNAPYQHLITLADAYARHLNVSHWRVAFLVRGDGQFFKRLRDGKGCTLKTATNTVQWFEGIRLDDRLSGRNFGVATDRPARFNLTTLEPMLEDLHTRLAGVVIECLDWADFIPRYDREGTLFYLDPPYWGNEGDYGKALFSRDDFARMAEVLGGLKGRFIMSLNDVPGVRECFGRYRLSEVSTSYTIGDKADRSSMRAELLISNFELPA